MAENRVELAYNGERVGPAHNAYFGEGPYTLKVTNSWSHDAFFGHLMKSRAGRNVMIGNYFQGGLPQTDWKKTQAENYLLDLPCGNEAVVLDNIFVKNASGPNSNGTFMTYNTEQGICHQKSPNQTVNFRHNTLVAFTQLYDGQHQVTPFFFNSPGKGPQLPGDPLFPATSITLKNNLFVGFRPSTDRNRNFPWYGAVPAGVGPNLTGDFSDIDRSFAPKTEQAPSGDTAIVGQPAYVHRVGSGVRARATFGAQDTTLGAGSTSQPRSSARRCSRCDC